jgi:hypothetical protein
MEYVSGQTLKEKVATEGPLTAAESQKIIESILDAVEVVHKAGMLHRDIKPDNLIIGNNGRVVLIDFGSARAYSDERTIAQTAMVSPGYAPLEQYNPTARKGTFTDIYSIGATFYFMLTGEKPLNVTERYSERLKAPHEINPNVSMQVSSAVMLAMEMKAEDRFQNVEDFRLGLKQLGERKKGENKEKINKGLKPNGQRAKNAITLIWIVLGLEIVSLISGYFQYDLLQNAANGVEISMETALANDTREAIIGICYFIAFLISAVTFIQWFRRAYCNLHLRVDHLSQSEGWAAGSWFVPIVCLYRPYQIMKELYQKTKELLVKKGLSKNDNFTTGSLGWWWALWIINNIIGQFVFRFSMRAVTIEDFTISTVASIIGNIVGIPLALITIKVIKDYANVEPLLSEIKDEE